MKRFLGLTLTAALLTGCAVGGSDHREIRNLTQDFFDAMEHRDVELASRVVLPEGVFVNVRRSDGKRDIRSFNNADWLDRLEGREKDIRESFTGTPLILVEGDIATLWGEYEFEIEGEPSHTGIDVINFVRTEDGWRIAGGVYSMIREDD